MKIKIINNGDDEVIEEFNKENIENNKLKVIRNGSGNELI